MTGNYERGVEFRRTLLGPEMAAKFDKVMVAGEGISRFREYTLDAVFGNLWLRPGLDSKTRALICVVTDAIMGVEEELAAHLRIALAQGWTDIELAEAILHAGAYWGIPRARQSMLVADRVFAEARSQNS